MTKEIIKETIKKYEKDISTYKSRLSNSIEGGYRNAAHDLLDEVIDATIKIKELKRILNEY